MKIILNVTRCVIYLVAYWVMVALSYFGLDLFCAWIIEKIALVQHSLHPLAFWPLLFLFGFAIISILWNLFKAAIAVVTATISLICPYRRFGEWVSSASVLIFFVSYVYTVWWVNYETNSVFGIIACIVVTFMGLGLGMLITTTTSQVFIDRFVKGLEEGKFNSIEEF